MDHNHDDADNDEVTFNDDPSLLKLVFTVEGKAILYEDDEPVWFSDDSDEFAQEFGDDAFLEAEDDQRDVLKHLVDAELLNEDELPHVEVVEEIDDEDS